MSHLDVEGLQFHGKPHVWVQWKGTNVCADIHCGCGYHSHFDGDFMYFIRCPSCQKVWEVGSHIALYEPADPAHAAERAETAETMSDVKPALTAEEWAERWHGVLVTDLCLRDDGFTREDVAALRATCPECEVPGGILSRLADRIEALLPPE
jgi:hypothetical protein